MITDKTLDEALVELLRTKRALEALRAKRKAEEGVKICSSLNCHVVNPVDAKTCESCAGAEFYGAIYPDRREHAAAKRASLDLTRKLAQLRAGK